jgi:uncharacterized protein YheU (UPF0270 family)
MDEPERPVRVPLSSLSRQALEAIAQDFCTRDGTDYGEVELTLPQRVAMLMGQLECGEAHILFEATTQTLRIVTSDELQKLPDPAAES